MIISKAKKSLKAFFLYLILLPVGYLAAQTVVPPPRLTPAPPFPLLNTGYGGAALGMGGAFVAVADDLSAVYWNPGGLGRLQGLQIMLDYRIMGDSDEDIGSEVFPDTFQSPQRYSISGNQFNAIAVSYSFLTRNYNFVPVFAWHRLSHPGPQRQLKETAGFVTFETSRLFFQSEGTFQQEFQGTEEEYVFGIGARVSPKIVIGGTWNFLTAGPEYTLSGNFHETGVLVGGGTVRADMQLDLEYREKISGNYLKIGALFLPDPPISLGGFVRFPYTRRGEISSRWKGTAAYTTGTIPFDLDARADTEAEVPMEWSLGTAVQTRPGLLLSTSVTYSDWSDVVRTIQNTSENRLIPVGQQPYPTERLNAGKQFELLQWRAGVQYKAGQGPYGLVMRSGIFRDGQPLSNKGGKRANFNGYSFGLGYLARGFRLDFAFIRERGEIFIAPQSQSPSSFTHRRFVLAFSYIGL